ncbi:hypothetical protein AB0756_23320 [Tolypothrix campylonemoides VB511288_2]|uniref:Uncharacterized protein n=3 Tax=Nostocales TaxID=1161 RepID=A0A8S9T7K5_9CYAN|nr:hypothetical protein [Tolypothrix bouteillei]KAF3888385.1 hypothetical protein DA73_0400025015 [Tolypothrix bouteillei VB521301]
MTRLRGPIVCLGVDISLPHWAEFFVLFLEHTPEARVEESVRFVFMEFPLLNST